jgi:hypothetical protein
MKSSSRDREPLLDLAESANRIMPGLPGRRGLAGWFMAESAGLVIASGSEAIQTKAVRAFVWIASSLRSLAMTFG